VISADDKQVFGQILKRAPHRHVLAQVLALLKYKEIFVRRILVEAHFTRGNMIKTAYVIDLIKVFACGALRGLADK